MSSTKLLKNDGEKIILHFFLKSVNFVTIELDVGVFKEVNMKNFPVMNSENSAFRHEGGMSVLPSIISYIRSILLY